jgi:predicted NBD/HSP70 family sugar kinase
LYVYFAITFLRKRVNVISTRPAACVEVGASNIQTVLFEGDGSYRVIEGAHQPKGFELAIAVPGLILDGMVAESSNLGWRNVDPVVALGLSGPAKVVVNDAEAAGLGEAVLRAAKRFGPLVYLGLGTGIGGAVVDGGKVLAGNLFGHMGGFSSARCTCGRTGCLETVAAGWSLPYPIDEKDLARASSALATGITSEPLASGVPLVVIGGGITRRYPRIVDMTRAHLNGLAVEPTQAPSEAKSAAAWGLSYLSSNRGAAEPEDDGSRAHIRMDTPATSMDT